jgi:hypothetical protein
VCAILDGYSEVAAKGGYEPSGIRVPIYGGDWRSGIRKKAKIDLFELRVGALDGVHVSSRDQREPIVEIETRGKDALLWGENYRQIDFADALDIDDPNAIAALGLALGLDPGMMLASIADPEIKALARRYGEEAVGRGVFGSPWISTSRSEVASKQKFQHSNWNTTQIPDAVQIRTVILSNQDRRAPRCLADNRPLPRE